MRAAAMRRTRLLAIAVALLAVSFALPVSAQTDPSEISGNELADGTWTGSFTASGVKSFSEAGINSSVTIEDSGTFSFAVVRGSTSGTWSSTGSNNWHTDPGQSATIVGSSTLQSSGTLSGDRTNLTATGTTAQAGTLNITARGRSITQPISSTTPLTFSMNVTGASCEAATGVLSGSFISGTFTAINGASFDGDLSAAEKVALVSGLKEQNDNRNNFINRMGWSGDALPEGTTPPREFPMADFMNLMAEAEAVLNELRNLSNCIALQIGQDKVETWDNLITRGVAQMIKAAVESYPLPIEQVRTLLSAGLRTGAIGSGATDLSSAAAAEEALRVRAEEIVNRGGVGFREPCANPGGRGCIVFHNHVLSALLVGAQMGWSFEVEFWDGTTATFTAIDLLSRPDRGDL